MSEDELKIEREHVKYWEDCLNSLSKHFEIILNYLNLDSKLKNNRKQFEEKLKSDYKSESHLFKKEPSHIYFLTEIYFSFYSYLGKKIDKQKKKILINTIKEALKNLVNIKKETCNDTLKLISECKSLILNIKKEDETFTKAKTAIENAHNNQKKINNSDKYTYNVEKKHNADLLLSEKLKDMQKIKNPIENYKKLLLEKTNQLNNLIKNNFEIIVCVSFKHLSIYYKCLFLILNQKLEILINLREKLDDILTQLSNSVFDLNDYSEKKFGESELGLKTEGLNIYFSTELINKSSMKLLIEISKNIINYVKIFLICLRYRKKIMKIFSEEVSKIFEFENDNINKFNEGKKEFILQLDSLKIINNNGQRFLRNLITKERMIEIIKEIDSINPVIKNYIEFVKNEYSTFMNNWENYEEKILERQKLSNEFLDEIKEMKNSNKKINQPELIARNNKKENKLKNAILAGLDFIQRNVSSTREKDKNEMMKLGSSLEKIFINCQNINNEYISRMENELNSTATADIFEECRIMIIKYFNRFKIQNYDKFIEKIKMKLLVNTDLSEGKLGKIIYENIKKGIDNQIELSNENNDSFECSSSDFQINSEYYFQKSRRPSVILKPDQRISPLLETNSVNDINNKTFIVPNKINKISNNNNNIKNKYRRFAYHSSKNLISDKMNINKEKDIKNDINININENEIDEEFEQLSNNDIINELEKEDRLEFIQKTQLSKYTEVVNPYSNIKDEELDRLLNMKKEDLKSELEEGEKEIQSFNCSLKTNLILRGTFTITNKKVEYNSSFLKRQKIIIPLKDIISIKKTSSLGIDNSIEIKTEKVTHIFTSFLSRDDCFLILQNQINEIKKKENIENKDTKEEQDQNSPEQKYLKKKKFKAKQITKMLEEIEFNKKIEKITKERIELFTKKYYDEKNGVFIPNSEFTEKFVDMTFDDFPLFIPFKVLCKVSSKLEEYKRDKGFFESLFLDRGDTEVKFQDNPEFSKNLPAYFDDGDYVISLFSQFNKEEIENFLNNIQNWTDKYEASCYAVHKVIPIPFGPSRVIMKNRYIAYFISPTCLYFDDLAYATGFQFSDKFMPLFRYKFDCNIKFNEEKCKFEFKTRMTISYTTCFFGGFWLASAVKSKSKGDCEQLIKGEVIDKLKDSFNLYIGKYKNIFERSTDETFQRKIDLKQNMITGEIEEEVLNDIENEDDKKIDNKKEEENNEEKKENKENKIDDNGLNQKIIRFIDKYKLYIFIGIVALTFIAILNSFFSKKEGSFALNTIFNLIILSSIFYLFKFN